LSDHFLLFLSFSFPSRGPVELGIEKQNQNKQNNNTPTENHKKNSNPQPTNNKQKKKQTQLLFLTLGYSLLVFSARCRHYESPFPSLLELRDSSDF